MIAAAKVRSIRASFFLIAAATAAAGLISSTAFADGNGPPRIPKGAIETGRGVNMGSPDLADGRMDQSGGSNVLYLRWVAWRLYLAPTDNVDVQLIFSCWQRCMKQINGHTHPGGCSLATCCAQDPNVEHKGEIASSSKQEFEASVAEALKITTKVTDKITSELHAGVEAGGAKVGGSVKREQTWSQTTVGQINRSVREMFGRANTGAITVRTGHFCTDPCSERERGYGTRDWEVHLVWQVFEQPYTAPGGWVEGVGGAGGLLPKGPLKLAGDPKWLGDPSDETIGVVKIPSDSPLFDRPVPTDCPCNEHPGQPNRPKSPGDPGKPGERNDPPNTPTPGGGSPVDSSGRAGTHAVLTVDASPGDRLVVYNPFNSPLTLTNAGTQVTVVVDPSGSKTLDPSWRNVTASLATVTLYAIRPGKGVPPDPSPPVPPGKKAELQPSTGADGPLKFGNKGLLDVPSPFSAPEVFFADQTRMRVEFASMRTTRLPGGTSFTPVVAVRDLPTGSSVTATARDGSPESKATLLFTKLSADGRHQDSFVQLSAPMANGTNVGLVKLQVDSAAGERIGEETLHVTRADMRANLVPPNGAPGSPAQVILDYRDWLRAIKLAHPGFETSSAVFHVDYSQSGGASGPSTVPVDGSGRSTVRIKRGTVAGSFPLAIQVAPK